MEMARCVKRVKYTINDEPEYVRRAKEKLEQYTSWYIKNGYTLIRSHIEQSPEPINSSIKYYNIHIDCKIESPIHVIQINTLIICYPDGSFHESAHFHFCKREKNPIYPYRYNTVFYMDQSSFYGRPSNPELIEDAILMQLKSGIHHGISSGLSSFPKEICKPTLKLFLMRKTSLLFRAYMSPQSHISRMPLEIVHKIVKFVRTV
jgi:hypothetical protein